MTEAKHNMKQVQLKDVQANFEQILDEVLGSGEPLKIWKDPEIAILVSEEVWRGMTETLHLLYIPGMRDSIRSGMRSNCALKKDLNVLKNRVDIILANRMFDELQDIAEKVSTRDLSGAD